MTSTWRKVLTLMIVISSFPDSFQEIIIHIDLVLMMLEFFLQSLQFVGGKSSHLGLFPQPIQFLVFEHAFVQVRVGIMGPLQKVKSNETMIFSGFSPKNFYSVFLRLRGVLSIIEMFKEIVCAHYSN